MSFDDVKAIINTRGIPRNAKDVLICLADKVSQRHAERTGRHEAWRFREEIADLMDMSVRDVDRGFKWCKDNDVLTPASDAKTGGRHRAVSFLIDMHAITQRYGNTTTEAGFIGVNPAKIENNTATEAGFTRNTATEARNTATEADRSKQSDLSTKRENKGDRTRDPVAQTPANVTPISLSHASHEDARETPEDREAIHILCVALEEHCTPPRVSERDQTPIYARKLLQMSATPAEVKKRVKAWKDQCWNNGAQPNITPKVLFEHWESLGPKTAPAIDRKRQEDEDIKRAGERRERMLREIDEAEKRERQARLRTVTPSEDNDRDAEDDRDEDAGEDFDWFGGVEEEDDAQPIDFAARASERQEAAPAPIVASPPQHLSAEDVAALQAAQAALYAKRQASR